MKFMWLCVLLRNKGFERFLNMLPSLLVKPQVSFSAIETLNKIASHNIPVFCYSLDGWIEAILGMYPLLLYLL